MTLSVFGRDPGHVGCGAPTDDIIRKMEMKTLAIAAVALMLAGSTVAFAQTDSMSSTTTTDTTTMGNNTTHHHKKTTHHKKTKKHAMGNNTSSSTTEQLNNSEATNTAQ
jgi:hypothetical protein